MVKFGGSMSKFWDRGLMREPVEIATMGSSGPWYQPTVKAHSLLGRRAVAKGQMTTSDVAAQIEANLSYLLPKNGTGHAPTRQMARTWEKTSPDYPEWAINNGLVNQTDLLPWAKSQLRISGEGNDGAGARRVGRGSRKPDSAAARSRRANKGRRVKAKPTISPGVWYPYPTPNP
jgi:hypothetical protein